MSAPAEPQLLKGKYELGRKLGSGGMGAVFFAHHKLLRQNVAVKMMTPGAAESAVAVERFLREARALAAIRHPAVCQVFDVDTNDDGLPFIVMEYLEGQTLDFVIKAKPSTPLEDRVRWIVQAAEGLAATHEKNIVHRDVKPSNLMLLADGSVKVVDFGVAKQQEDDTRNLTGDAAIGTVKYMSPEQLMGEPVDQRSDIWSLGVTLYQLLASRLPYDADTIGQYVSLVMSQPPQTLERRGVNVPPGLWAALERALQPVAKRTPTMRAFIEDLRPYVQPSTEAITTPEVTSRVAPTKRLAPLAVVIACVVVGFGAVAFFARNQQAPVVAPPLPVAEPTKPVPAPAAVAAPIEPRVEAPPVVPAPIEKKLPPIAPKPTEKVVVEKPAVEKPAVEKPAVEKPVVEKPVATEKVVVEKAVAPAHVAPKPVPVADPQNPDHL